MVFVVAGTTVAATRLLLPDLLPGLLPHGGVAGCWVSQASMHIETCKSV